MKNRLKQNIVLAALALGVLAPSTPVDNGPEPTLNAVLWTQTSAERDALALQTFKAATEKLDSALADPRGTAALEQTISHAMDPAVIIDVDETVLDNTPFNARLIRDGETFDPQKWTAWVEERRATPIPGALGFLRECATRGITIFYVTNRTAPEEEATRDVLEAWGFPIGEEHDTVLTKEEHPEWTSDKTTRRAHVAETHRVLMILGDDLHDFVPKRSRTPQDRKRLSTEFSAYWGERWFMLPNPVYGSWERSLPSDCHGALEY